MKKEQPKLNVVVHGELDLSKIPKDIFDLLIAALTEEMIKTMENDKQDNWYNDKLLIAAIFNDWQFMSFAI